MEMKRLKDRRGSSLLKILREKGKDKELETSSQRTHSNRAEKKPHLQ